jgi:hypothetical protein
MDGSGHEPVLIGKADNPVPDPQIEKVHKLSGGWSDGEAEIIGSVRA